MSNTELTKKSKLADLIYYDSELINFDYSLFMNNTKS